MILWVAVPDTRLFRLPEWWRRKGRVGAQRRTSMKSRLHNHVLWPKNPLDDRGKLEEVTSLSVDYLDSKPKWFEVTSLTNSAKMTTLTLFSSDYLVDCLCCGNEVDGVEWKVRRGGGRVNESVKSKHQSQRPRSSEAKITKGIKKGEWFRSK